MSGPVRVYQPGLSVPVLQAPRVQRVDVSSGIQAAADVALQIEQRGQSRKLNELRLGATTRLEEAQIEADKQPWDQRAKFFEAEAAKIKTELTGGLGTFDGVVRGAFDEDWGKLYGPRNVEVRHSARKGEIDHNVALLDVSLDTFSKQAAQAPTKAQADIFIELAGKTIADAQHGGFLTEVEAGERVRGTLRGIDKNRANALIKENPTAGLEAIQDTTRFPNLREEDRQALEAKADAGIERHYRKIEHQAVMGERNRKRESDRISLEIDKQIAGGDRAGALKTFNDSIDNLDEADRRNYMRAFNRGGEGGSAQLYGDLRLKAERGENVNAEAREALGTGNLSEEQFNKLISANVNVDPPYKAGKDYITDALKPGLLDKYDPNTTQRFADAADAWDEWARQHPKATPADARTAYKRIVRAAKESNRPAKTQVPVGAVMKTDGTLDVEKSGPALIQAYKKKHKGNMALVQADPDYQRDVKAFTAWEAYQADQEFLKALEAP